MSLPTPEVAAIENAHCKRMARMEAVIRAAMLADGELLLKDIFEDSQYRLDVEERIKEDDDFKAKIADELRDQVADDLKQEVRDAVSTALNRVCK